MRTFTNLIIYCRPLPRTVYITAPRSSGYRLLTTVVAREIRVDGRPHAAADDSDESMLDSGSRERDDAESSRIQAEDCT